MDREMIKSDDCNVAYRKVYAKASDEYGYVDSKCTEKISADDLQEAFLKGLVIVETASKAEYLPVSCIVDSGIATVTYVVADSSVETTAKLATIKSE